MAKVHNNEFKREAVRIALTSGQPRRQVVSDLGVGFSILTKWIRPGSLPSATLNLEHSEAIDYPVQRAQNTAPSMPQTL